MIEYITLDVLQVPKGGKNYLPFTLELAAEPVEPAAPPELPELCQGDVSLLQQRFQ